MTARLVSVWRDDRLVGVALAEQKDSSGWNLVFERSNAFTDTDRKAGQDTYCITNQAGVAVYGGASNWNVAGTELALSLADVTATELGLPGELTIALALSAADIGELNAGLAEILK
jgi:hypothetical protein